MKTILNNRLFQIYFLVFISLLILLGRQLDTGITNFDDAYYAQKAKEMHESGNLWIVTHAGQPAFDNPPLPFWLMSLAYSLFGVSSFSAVFFSSLFGTGLVVLTHRLADYLYKDPWIGFVASLVLLFPGIFIDASRRAMVDIPLAFFVTLAIFSFIKAKNHSPWYLVFGLATAGGILTKSVLGIFPLAIVFTFLVIQRQWKEMINPFLLVGISIALSLGFSWHLINWFQFGQEFINTHFGILIFNRGFGEIENPLYFLGYAEDFARNYWPWLPFALIGLYKFGKRGFVGKDENSLLLFWWAVLVFIIMSTSKNHTIRYVVMIFPALSIIIAKTFFDGLDSNWKDRLVGGLAGVACLTALFVNATPFQAKVTLGNSSKDVRQLASVIQLNTPKNMKIGNFGLSAWNPKHALLFYSDRVLDLPLTDTGEILKQMKADPKKLWLSNVSGFKVLKNLAPDGLHLIQANGKYAFFTSSKNRDPIHYDFSAMKTPPVK